jgi:hypothetical protein
MIISKVKFGSTIRNGNYFGIFSGIIVYGQWLTGCGLKNDEQITNTNYAELTVFINKQLITKTKQVRYLVKQSNIQILMTKRKPFRKDSKK